MSAFKKAGVVVTTPSSGTYVIEAIGNVGLLADLLNEYLEDLPDDAGAEGADPNVRPIGRSSRRKTGATASRKKSQPASKARTGAPPPTTQPEPTAAAAADDDDDDASREETEDDAVAEAAGVIGDLTTELTRRDDDDEGADDAEADDAKKAAGKRDLRGEVARRKRALAASSGDAKPPPLGKSKLARGGGASAHPQREPKRRGRPAVPQRGAAGTRLQQHVAAVTTVPGTETHRTAR